MKDVDAVWVPQPRKKTKFEESADIRSGEREFTTNKVTQQTIQAINKKVHNFVPRTLQPAKANFLIKLNQVESKRPGTFFHSR